MSLSTVHKIIKDICSSNGDAGAKAYIPISRQLSRTLVSLKLNTFPSFGSGVFTIKDDLSINLGSEASRTIKVGRLLEDGSIRTFGKVISRAEADPLCACSSSSSPDESKCISCTYYSFGSYYGEMYNCSTDYFEAGKWSEEVPGTITLHSGYDVLVGNRVFVQYELAVHRDTNMLVPDEFYDMIRCHVLWKYWGALKPNLSNKFLQELQIEIEQKKRNTLKYSDEYIVGALLANINN